MSEVLERWRWYIVALLAVPMLVGTGMLLQDELDGPQPLVIEPGELSTDIRVYVVGAVTAPGVYPLADGSRWADAVAAAGGATAEADLAAVNLARHARDEDQIVVPAVGQTAVAGASAEPLISINTASQSLLETLPGIGEVRAGAIVQSRTVDGPFGAAEDLLSRELVPESVFEEIAPLITVY